MLHARACCTRRRSRFSPLHARVVALGSALYMHASSLSVQPFTCTRRRSRFAPLNPRVVALGSPLYMHASSLLVRPFTFTCTRPRYRLLRNLFTPLSWTEQSLRVSNNKIKSLGNKNDLAYWRFAFHAVRLWFLGAVYRTFLKSFKT